MNASDEVYAFTSYKLFREKKSWTEAELHCESEGGQLASIHSLWEQTLAKKAAEGNEVWLGGRKLTGSGWQWADKKALSFTNWKNGSPSHYSYLMMHNDGRWDDFAFKKYYFLCQGKIVTENGLTSVNV